MLQHDLQHLLLPTLLDDLLDLPSPILRLRSTSQAPPTDLLLTVGLLLTELLLPIPLLLLRLSDPDVLQGDARLAETPSWFTYSSALKGLVSTRFFTLFDKVLIFLAEARSFDRFEPRRCFALLAFCLLILHTPHTSHLAGNHGPKKRNPIHGTPLKAFTTKTLRGTPSQAGREPQEKEITGTKPETPPPTTRSPHSRVPRADHQSPAPHPTQGTGEHSAHRSRTSHPSTPPTAEYPQAPPKYPGNPTCPKTSTRHSGSTHDPESSRRSSGFQSPDGSASPTARGTSTSSSSSSLRRPPIPKTEAPFTGTPLRTLTQRKDPERNPPP